MKKIKKILNVMQKLNLAIVIMPITMMIFALLGIIAVFSNNHQFIFWVYLFYTILFIFIPSTTLLLVLNKFKLNKKRRNSLLKRMAITSIGTWVLIIGLFFEIFRSEILFIFGFGGFLYFLFDYIKQRRLYISIKNKPGLMLKGKDEIELIMETKCSRSILYEYTRYLKNKEEKNRIRLIMTETNYRWYHLHPTSVKSLTDEIISFLLTVRIISLFLSKLKK